MEGAFSPTLPTFCSGLLRGIIWQPPWLPSRPRVDVKAFCPVVIQGRKRQDATTLRNAVLRDGTVGLGARMQFTWFTEKPRTGSGFEKLATEFAEIPLAFPRCQVILF